MTIRSANAGAAVLPLIVMVSACVVHKEEDAKTNRVTIDTPIGALVARTGKNAGNTDLPVYPGAQVSRDGRNGENEKANVTIGTPWFGLQVRAAEYESVEPPEPILEFYRERMKAFGPVTECRGDVNFDDRKPVCRTKSDSEDVQLLTGTEDRHRIVSVKPHGTGTQFALVSIQLGSK